MVEEKVYCKVYMLKDICKMLGVDRRTLLRWQKNEKVRLPTRIAPGRWLKADIDQWMLGFLGTNGDNSGQAGTSGESGNQS